VSSVLPKELFLGQTEAGVQYENEPDRPHKTDIWRVSGVDEGVAPALRPRAAAPASG
jgi:hypothetical protein